MSSISVGSTVHLIGPRPRQPPVHRTGCLCRLYRSWHPVTPNAMRGGDERGRIGKRPRGSPSSSAGVGWVVPPREGVGGTLCRTLPNGPGRVNSQGHPREFFRHNLIPWPGRQRRRSASPSGFPERGGKIQGSPGVPQRRKARDAKGHQALQPQDHRPPVQGRGSMAGRPGC